MLWAYDYVYIRLLLLVYDVEHLRTTLMVILVSQSLVTSASFSFWLTFKRLGKFVSFKSILWSKRDGHWKRLYKVCPVDNFSTNYIV